MNNQRRIHRHLVRALAAGALLAAAALPMAIATAAGAATTYTVTFSSSQASNTGPGDAGTFIIVASAATFAGDGGNGTVTSSNAGVTFSSVVDTDNTSMETITGNYATAATAVAGAASLTVTDDAGTTTLANAITVDAAPTAASLSVASIPDNPNAGYTAVTVTGSGFFSEASATNAPENGTGNPTVTFTNTANGTTLTSNVVTAPPAYPLTAATLAIRVEPFNSVNGKAATPGTYTLTVTNPDGGTVTTGAIFTVLGDEVSDVSPSSVPGTASTAYPITINGGGFETGAAVFLYASGTTNVCAYGSLSAVALQSSGQFTATLTTAGTATTSAEVCDVYVVNSGAGDNGAGYDLAGAIGFDGPSAAAPIIASSSLTSGTGLTAGAPSTTVVLTGTGFGAFNGPITTLDPSGVTTNATLSGCIANGAGTTLTCNVFAGNTGTHTGVEGAYTADVNGRTLANAFSVTGPAITSIAPTALAKGAPIGTTIAITGTGFLNNTGGTVAHVSGGDALAGNFEYSSATTVNFVVTTPPTVAGALDSLAVTGVDAYGYTVASAPAYLNIDATPTVTSLTYVAGTTGVGVGATAQKIVIGGTGFEAGATVGTFVNGTAVADANVTSTSITATIAIKAGDTNTIDGYTITNIDGGSTKVIAVAPLGLKIDAAPAITAVSPATGLASSTTAFTITGTGFAPGAVVTPSSDGTCGTATVASATSITVSCTLGAPSAKAVTLSVSNPDGGSAISATVLAAATTKPPAKPFHVSGVHGRAVAGETVNLTITGTGFHGQPRITSSAPGTRSVVSRDTGTTLVVRVTTKKGTKPGVKVFTITQSGKVAKTHYSVIK